LLMGGSKGKEFKKGSDGKKKTKSRDAGVSDKRKE